MNDRDYMALALEEARAAFAIGEVPIGAVIVKDGIVIAKGYNMRESSQQVSDHAELIAIKEACKTLNSWRLDGCTLYCTLEPCAMCSGAIIQSRIDRVVYGANDIKNGAHVSKTQLFDITFNHKVSIEGGLLEKESTALIKAFFNTLRKEKNGV